MASIFSACKENVEVELGVGRATTQKKGRARLSFQTSDFGEAELFANRSSKI